MQQFGDAEFQNGCYGAGGKASWVAVFSAFIYLDILKLLFGHLQLSSCSVNFIIADNSNNYSNAE